MGFNEIIGGFLSLINFAKNLILIVEKLLLMAPKMVMYFIYFFTTPGKVISDAIYGFTTGIKMIIKSIIDTLMGKSIGLIKLHVRNDDPSNDKREKEECVNPSLLEILILLLCPPLAIFIRKGLKGFFTIVITAVLTYFYYLPGLIYASLYVL
jgi:uncharacterized membrane protein YqaE (UPF0057 family)